MSEKTHKSQENIPLGVAFIVCAVFAMSFADAMIKYVSSTIPLWQLFVVRSLMVIAALTAFLIFKSRSEAVHPSAWSFLRGLLLTGMYIAIYGTVPVLSLPVIAASLYTAPLFITLLSALLLNEPVGPRRWAGIAVGFAGVLVILRPASEGFTAFALVPVAAAFFYALAAIITRSKCRAEAPIALAMALNFSLLAVGLLATTAIAVFQPISAASPFLLGEWIAMGPREWGIVSLLASLMLVISIGLAKAYQSAPSSVIATFDYSYLIFAAFWSMVIFSDPPDTLTIAGIVLIAAAGFLVIGRSMPLAAKSRAHLSHKKTETDPNQYPPPPRLRP
ncbi:DMT family transporter [Aestuariivirga sp.]|uniref:DMT family transporter n=1 Tax=Aestuariivirga sp. TaxID=2650926 RepID=UPI0039E5765C